MSKSNEDALRDTIGQLSAACAERDKRIATLERNLDDARAARDLLLDKNALPLLNATIAAARITQLVALLERVPHGLTGIIGSFNRGSVCKPNCPACQFAALRKQWGEGK